MTDNPSHETETTKQTAFDYRLNLMRELSQRWNNLSHEYDQLAAADWEGTRARRADLVSRMSELNRVMRDLMPWINP